MISAAWHFCALRERCYTFDRNGVFIDVYGSDRHPASASLDLVATNQMPTVVDAFEVEARLQ